MGEKWWCWSLSVECHHKLVASLGFIGRLCPFLLGLAMAWLTVHRLDKYCT